MTSGQGGPASPPDQLVRQAKRSTVVVTAEQARRELERRQLPKERRHQGRARAHEDGTFYLSNQQLAELAEGGP